MNFNIILFRNIILENHSVFVSRDYRVLSIWHYWF